MVGKDVTVAVGMGVSVGVCVTGTNVGVAVGGGAPSVQAVNRKPITNKNRFMYLLRLPVTLVA